jgi:hypothetical protein
VNALIKFIGNDVLFTSLLESEDDFIFVEKVNKLL